MLTPHPDRITKLHINAVTIYFRGGYGMTKLECRELLIETGPYAQYEGAIFVSYVPKGARKPRAFVQTYQPDIVALAGWDHFNRDDSILPEQDAGTGVSVARGRYQSCDPRWASDFGAKLANYLGARGIALAGDFRGHNSSERLLNTPVACPV